MYRTLLFILLIFGSSCLFDLKAQKATAEVPFKLDNGHIIVSTMYKEKTELDMVVSTFYPSFIDSRVPHVQKTLLKAYSHRVGTTNREIPVSQVSYLTIGTTSIPKIQMYWSDTLGSPNKPLQSYQGVLGSEFFKVQVVRIDYLKNILSVYKGDSSRDLFKPPSTNENRVIVKFDVKTSSFPFEMTYLTTEDILVDGKKVKILLSLDEISKGYEVEKKKIKLGGIELNDVPLIKGDPKRFEYILGVDFMKNYIVTVDVSGKRMMFEAKSKL